MLSRRDLLRAAPAAGLLLPRRARAAAATERKFIFVQALGAWDVTQVFAPVFGSDGVVHQAGAALAESGGLRWTTHAERPDVDTFLAKWGAQTAFLNGINVASIAHPSALRLMLTSALDAGSADWATRIGGFSAADPVLPHFVVGGQYYAGTRGVDVGRGGSSGQLQGLASGDILLTSDVPVVAPTAERAAGVDAWLAAALARRGAKGAAGAAQNAAYVQALDRSVRMKDMAALLDFGGGDELDDQLETALGALERGVARCVTVAHPYRDAQMSYDSHAINDLLQSPLFNSLFASLGKLFDRLATTASPSGASLADEVVVVVLSEMARSPVYNGSNGRDHWPVTAAMVVGAGVAGGQTYGGWDDTMMGKPTDLASGQPATGGVWLGPEHLGATLCALADIDPADAGLTVGPVAGMLA